MFAIVIVRGGEKGIETRGRGDGVDGLISVACEETESGNPRLSGSRLSSPEPPIW